MRKLTQDDVKQSVTSKSIPQPYLLLILWTLQLLTVFKPSATGLGVASEWNLQYNRFSFLKSRLCFKATWKFDLWCSYNDQEPACDCWTYTWVVELIEGWFNIIELNWQTVIDCVFMCMTSELFSNVTGLSLQAFWSCPVLLTTVLDSKSNSEKIVKTVEYIIIFLV